MVDNYTQDNLQLSISTPLGKDALLVRGFSGSEALSNPFAFNLDLLSERADLGFSDIVGKQATLTVARIGGSGKRYISGIVGRFVQAGGDDRFTFYQAELRPWLWLLNFSSDNRIFQNLSVPSILESVFTDLGFSDFRSSLTASYATRDYCVQYAETNFDFVSRLMEDEGIGYFFEHADGVHTLVLADDQDAYQSCPGIDTVNYQGQPTQQPAATDLLSCRLEENVVTAKYQSDDFNFETPSTQLRVTDGSGTVAQTIYDYPGDYGQTSDGQTLSRVRLEALEHAGRCLSGDAAVYAFTSGYTFALAGYPRADANTDYVLRSIQHQATQNTYTNSFEAFPLSVPYRPTRITARPRIAGAQTAIVVGKSGEEIWTDKYGRIKVQFHWDQLGKSDENSSCWIRVAQGWAGKAWGQFFLPRIGQEVVVSFLEGDPDRPLITGSVYNAEQTVPYALPGEQTKSTIKSNSSKGGGGFNELRFEDKKDSEEVYLHAQKDMDTVVENDRTKSVGNDETNTIKNNRTTTIEEQDESLTVAKGNRTVAVTEGDETHSVGGQRTLTVTKDESHTSDANFTHKVTKDYTLTIDGNLSIKVTGDISFKGKSISSQADTSVEHKAGTSLTNQAGTSLTNKAGTQLTNESSGTMKSSATGMHDVEASGILSLKGSMVKVN